MPHDLMEERAARTEKARARCRSGLREYGPLPRADGRPQQEVGDFFGLARLRQPGTSGDGNALIFRDRALKGRHYPARYDNALAESVMGLCQAEPHLPIPIRRQSLPSLSRTSSSHPGVRSRCSRNRVAGALSRPTVSRCRPVGRFLHASAVTFPRTARATVCKAPWCRAVSRVSSPGSRPRP